MALNISHYLCAEHGNPDFHYILAHSGPYRYILVKVQVNPARNGISNGSKEHVRVLIILSLIVVF